MTSRIVEGRLIRSAAIAPRRICAHCRHVHVDRSDLGEAAILNHVVEVCLTEGVAPAARILHCDERIVASTLRRWIALREDEIVNARPVTMAFHPVRSNGMDRVIVCDVDDISILDLVVDHESLPTWIGTRPGRTDLALVPVDPRTVSSIASLLPSARLVVSPRSAATAIATAARRTLEDSHGRRNYREDADLLLKPDADLTSGEREEISTGWRQAAKGLRRHVQSLCAAIRKGRPEFETRLVDAMGFLEIAYPRSILHNLLTTWGKLLAQGAGETWLDVVDSRISDLSAIVEKGFARVSFDILRIATVFPHLARSENGGIDVADLTRHLAAGPTGRGFPSTARSLQVS